MRIKVKGLSKWNNWMEGVEEETQQEVKALVKETSYKVERTAKQLAPVDTGYLRNNIKTDIEGNSYVGVVTSNADYSVYVEYGTRYMSAQPFMTPAAFQHEEDFAQGIKRIIKKVGG